MSPLRPILAVLLFAHTAGAALAADWQLVLSDRNRRVEIDRASILNSDAGTKISWGRVVLTSEEAKASGYAMIKALNRYDCRNRTFVTVKRVYVDADDNIVREEPVADQTALTVARNSVDERMWREVCNPPSAAELQKLATEAARLTAPPTAASPPALPAASSQSAPRAAANPPAPSAPQAAARPDSALAPPLVRTAQPAVAGAAAAGPVTETHVEIPAKFLPGGNKQATETAAPRKSILPPLPALAGEAGAAAPAAGAAGAPKPAATAAATPPATPPATPSATPPAVHASAAAPAGRTPAATADPATPAMAAPTRAAPREAKAAVHQAPAAAAVRTPPTPAASPVRPPRTAGVPAEDSAPARVALAPRRADQGGAAPGTAPTAVERSGIRVTTQPANAAGWSYEGETGPEHWARLRPEWRVCAEGMRQSPIDLRDGIAVDLAPVKFDYGRSGFRIRDTGNTLQVDVGEGMGITVRGVRYALERFTLHRPSQDRVGGMAHDMAIYLEHRSADGKQAILSVLLAAGGEPHPVLQTLWNNLPLDRGREHTPDAVIDLAQLVPADPGHFLYTGSLPMPPCTEDVLWVVMKQPLPIAEAQLAVFARLYPRNGRPIQPANGRLLLESR